jgi:hypothetical protein
MKPAYFPFSYIPEPTVRRLNSFFDQVIVYQPVLSKIPEMIRHLETEDLIEIRVPDKEDDDRLIQFCGEFKKWGELHQSESVSLKTIFQDGFYNTSFAAQIRTDILKENTDEPPDAHAVFSARLFLMMAQDLDIQQSTIDQGLALSIEDELNLFKNMTGEDVVLDPPKESYFDNDLGAYMTKERMDTWFQLVNNDKQLAPSVLVTTSNCVFNKMKEEMPAIEEIFSVEGILSEQRESVKKDFKNYLHQLTTMPWKGPDHIDLPRFKTGDSGVMNFKLCMLPEKSVSGMIGSTSGTDESEYSQSESLNTVIALFND